MSDPLADMYAQMNIGTNNQDTLDLDITPEEVVIPQDPQLCLIGTFLTDRVTNFDAMNTTFAAIWRPVSGVWMKELGPNLFLYQFAHEIDFQSIVDGSPWTFNQQLLVFS